MKKTYLFLFSLLCLALWSCGDDETGRPPVFQGFRYTPSTIHAGDDVTITAVQAQRGTNVYGARHSWSLTVRIDVDGTPTDTTLSYTTQAGKTESLTDDPTWNVHIPERTLPGMYTCSFRGNWNNAADGETATYSAGTGEGCTGSITSTNSTLYSSANGSFRLTVQ